MSAVQFRPWAPFNCAFPARLELARALFDAEDVITKPTIRHRIHVLGDGMLAYHEAYYGEASE